jgi:Bacteriophage related domain of unknown function
MASKFVKDAIAARAANWANIAACPLVEPNEAADSPLPRFLSIEYPVAIEERIGLGNPGLFREHGAARFVINILTLDGLAVALTWVEELRDLFREYQVSTLLMEEASPAEFDPNNQEGPRYEVPFVVTYQYDYEK